tara:strand:- start:169 stop:420 length:252 start_codon:yes stop_codon:yes gene_type:complete
MGNTAIEELIEYFNNTANVTFTGGKVVDYSISKLYYLQTLKFMRELKAKNNEEITNLESMVKEAINLPKGIEPHSFSDYKANH